jgi:tetratricopeptide (TPR) repeat protein
MAIRLALRALMILSVASLPASTAARAQELSGLAELARAAAERYLDGDYAGAAALYEIVIQAGVHDGPVYYNLGSAYLQTGDLGRAMLYYRRAQSVTPRDPDVNAGLAALRLQRTDLLGDETIFVDSLATATAHLLTQNELVWLMWCGWVAVCVALTAVIVGNDRWAAVTRPALAVTLLMLAIAGVLLANRLYVDSHRPAAVVTTPSTAVYSGPGETYLEIYQMHAATEIRLLETRGEWVRFVRPDARQGWIRRAAVTPVDE